MAKLIESKPEVNGVKGIQIVFVHSLLDEAGLSPIQFRTYCHIARRGECFASAATIAKFCRIKRITVWSAIKELEIRGMIDVIHRIGRTTVYRTTPLSKWNLTQKGHQVTRSEGGTTSRSQRGTAPWSEGGTAHLTQKGHHKVYPSEVSPTQSNPPKGESPPRNVPLTESEKIRLEHEKDRIEARLKQIVDEAPHDAWGPMYSDAQKTERAERKARVKEINQLLGCTI